jgi:hypothetical protein
MISDRRHDLHVIPTEDPPFITYDESHDATLEGEERNVRQLMGGIVITLVVIVFVAFMGTLAYFIWKV